jgi:hypothetical protein
VSRETCAVPGWVVYSTVYPTVFPYVISPFFSWV